jgi:hypothetical protein
MQATYIGWGAAGTTENFSNWGLRWPPSQTWRAFLNNHAECLAAMDFFTVATARFRVLYVFIVLSHDRRQVVHFIATEHTTAQWTAQQLVEAFPFDSAPRSLQRDRDAIYGKKVRRRIKSLGIEEVGELGCRLRSLNVLAISIWPQLTHFCHFREGFQDLADGSF